MVIKKKKPFYDWLDSIEPETSKTDDFETEVFLLPDYEEINQMENWIKRNFDVIFQEQLNNWFIDEETREELKYALQSY